MEKRAGITALKGNPIHLLGAELKVGDKAPGFNLRKGLLPDSAVKLSDFSGKVLLISVAPSLDTPVCATQTRTFNLKAAELENVAILTVTMDLPPAQGRFCTTEGIDKLVTASDYADKSFGMNYGFLVDEMQVLARGVVVVDKEGVVRYVEITKDIVDEPNYDAALEVAKSL